jgi:hypothetical protein
MITRLRAALDEDERVALEIQGGKAMNPAPWRYGSVSPRDDGILDALDHAVMHFHHHNEPTAHVVAHVLRHDPARVLRWVKAAREILDRHAPLPDVRPGGGLLRCAEFDRLVQGEYAQDWPCPEVLALASVYGDGDG